MIKNIIFDMGWVLLEYKPEDYVRKYVVDEDDVKLVNQEFFGGPEWPMNDRGTISDEEFISRVSERLPSRLHSSVKQLWEEWHSYLKPIESTNRLAIRLKERGYRVYLLSNVSVKYHIFRNLIPAVPFLDGEFISADIHYIKPEQEIYRRFFEKFRLNPEECFFIDDNPDNIAAAESLGMRGFLYEQDTEKLILALQNHGISI
jgi:putative hydrolase of the HAD superfamily